jgi:hypothetical protein
MQSLPGREAATRLLSIKKRHGRDMLVWYRRTGSKWRPLCEFLGKKVPQEEDHADEDENEDTPLFLEDIGMKAIGEGRHRGIDEMCVGS